MSIRLLAKDLYRIIKEVERIENELENASSDQKAEIKDRLRKAKAERDLIRRLMDGRKG
jgi:hypothetical protein